MNDMTLEEIARTVYFAIEKRWNVDIALMNIDAMDDERRHTLGEEKHVVSIETVEGDFFTIDIRNE